MSSIRKYLPDKLVCERYGICPSTLFRWDADENLGFPKPLRVRGRKYRDVAELDQFDALRAAKSSDTQA